MKSYLLSISLILTSFGFSQSQDAHLWTGIGVSHDLTNQLSIGYETQTRFYKNVSTLRVYMNQIGATYKIVKGVKIGLDYRFSRKKKDYYFVNENRLMLNASYGYKLKEINTKFSVRARYQHSFNRLKTINETITPNKSNVFRLKLQAKYQNPDFKRVQPFVGYEYFKSLDNETIQFFANRYRFIAGINLDLPFKHEVKLNYIYQGSNGSVPKLDHIYSIQYTYDLGGVLRR